MRRSTEETTFDIKEDCLFCAVSQKTLFASVRGRLDKTNELISVRRIDWKAELETKALNRDDEWGFLVHSRIAGLGDLVAAEAKYHALCMTAFYKGRSNPRLPKLKESKVGRKPNQTLSDCLEKLYLYLEENDECQYTLKELQSILNSLSEEPDICTVKWLKEKLVSHYGNDIIIADAFGQKDIICFRDSAFRVLRNKWAQDSDVRTCDEMILDMAAGILRDKIRIMKYDKDTYPSFSKRDEASIIPKELDRFLHSLIKSKSDDQTFTNRRCSSIGEAIVAAVRPRSFVSPILLSISSFIYRKYAAKELITILHKLGFAEGYDEIERLNAAFLEAGGMEPDVSGTFFQTVWDNADKNVRTLTGFDTFHALGGIAISTPKREPIERLIKRSSTKPTFPGTFTTLPIKAYKKPMERPLSKIKVEPITFGKSDNYTLEKALDLSWNITFSKQLSCIPFWSGFMQLIVNGRDFEESKVSILNFVNCTPSDPSTLFTALRYTQDLCDKHNLEFCPVTFDQPLYIKSVEILEQHKSELKSLFIRIGGFHNVMSFMGAIGTLMADSGLTDLWETVYAPNTAAQMETGHDYARALRAHILSAAAVSKNIIDTASETENIDYNELYNQVKSLITNQEKSQKVSEWKDFAEISSVKIAIDRLNKVLQINDKDCRTVKLWKQYLKNISTLRMFLFAERTGNHKLHVDCLIEMIPILHAGGHIPYARSIRIYLQQLNELKEKISANLYDLYTKKGYFTVRRKDCFWSGNFTDQTIEQDLMRLFKSAGGLTRGRHISEGTITRFVGSLPYYIPICDFLERFAGVYSSTSVQHKDLQPVNKKKDITDIEKFNCWLNLHNIHAYKNTSGLVCITNGLIAHSSVNCDQAYDIGEKEAMKFTGKYFLDTISRNSKAVTFRSSKKSVKVRGENVDINPQTFFNRITCILNSSEEMEFYLSFELSSEPVSLFKSGEMRSAQGKAKLGECFRKDVKYVDHVDGVLSYIVDGGYLLHKCIWPTNSTYRSVLNSYVQFVLRHYGKNVIVVFDGYGGINCTKTATRKMRASKFASQKISFDLDMMPVTKQEEFFGDETNKTNFICKLMEFLKAEGIDVKLAIGDADFLIVSTALDVAANTEDPVILAGNDTDLQCMLVERSTKGNLFVQLDTGFPSKIFRIQDAQANLTEEQRSVLNVVHCLSGCDTTSAVFGKKKISAWNVLKKMKSNEIEELQVFCDASASNQQIKSAGENFLLRWYSCPTTSSLDEQRYMIYNKKISKMKLTSVFKLETLPPTSDAAAQHSYRAYHTVQQCLGNNKDPSQWGWKRADSTLLPIMCTKQPAPDNLLKMISCGCKAGCNNTCGCRKTGMKCGPMCSVCQGQTCTNCPSDCNTEESDVIENEQSNN